MTKKHQKSNLPLIPACGDGQSQISLEKRGLQILAVLLLSSLWFQSWPVSLGLILGGGVGLLNFRWLWWILRECLIKKKKHSLFQLIGKFFLLTLAIFLAIRFARVNPVAFMIGVSAVTLAMVFETVRQSLRNYREGVW